MKRLGFLSWLALGASCVACMLAYRGAQAALAEYRSARPRPHLVPKPPDDALLRDAALAAFSSKRGLKIRGWWLPGNNGAAVILSHGAGADRRGGIEDAHLLAALGYGVLIYDHPGHGESEGPADWPTDMPDALSAALDWVLAQKNVQPRRVAAIGYSSGAGTVSRMAASDQRLAAVVLEGCFTDADQQLLYEYRKWGPIQTIPGRWAMRAFGIPKGSLRPIDHVASIAPRPLLIIHGSNDDVVPVEMAKELYAAAAQPKELWLVPGAHHLDYAQVAPDQYAQRLQAFLGKALLAPSP